MSNSLNLSAAPSSLAALLPTTKRAKKTISLTALIDVVFILLMFFMLTSTFIKWHKLELQTANAGSDSLVSEEKTQLVIIRENKTFSLLTTALTDDKHAQEFNALADLIAVLDPSLATVLIPQPQIDVQTIMTTLTQLKTANITQVTLGNVLHDKSED